MGVSYTWRSSSPAQRVFEVHRDRLAEFGGDIQGVRSIERVRTESSGDVTHLMHRWTGDPAVIPWMLRGMAPLFVWEDRSEWDAQALSGRWKITAPALGEMFRIEGGHRVEPRPDGCEVFVEAQLDSMISAAFGGAFLDRFLQGLFNSVMESATPVIKAELQRGDPSVGSSL